MTIQNLPDLLDGLLELRDVCPFPDQLDREIAEHAEEMGLTTTQLLAMMASYGGAR